MEKLRKSYPAIWEKVILNLQNLNDGSIKWITMDIFRADNDGRIVEHWDNREIVPSREELTNSGKFQYFRRINDKGNRDIIEY